MIKLIKLKKLNKCKKYKIWIKFKFQYLEYRIYSLKKMFFFNFKY